MADDILRVRAYNTATQPVKMENTFREKIVVVTGASSGIGRETVRLFAEHGAHVVPASRRSDPPCDVTRDDDVARVFADVERRFGRLDILINNAGIGARAPVAELRPDDTRRVIDVNFLGALRCTKAALPLLKKSSAAQIVNIGSILSVLATPSNSIYCASKFALRAWNDALRIELRDAGIEVISVLPGYTDTSFFDNQIRHAGPARLHGMKGQHPRKVAAAVLRACAGHEREIALTIPGRFGIWMKKLAPGLLDWSLQTFR